MILELDGGVFLVLSTPDLTAISEVTWCDKVGKNTKMCKIRVYHNHILFTSIHLAKCLINFPGPYIQKWKPKH